MTKKVQINGTKYRLKNVGILGGCVRCAFNKNDKACIVSQRKYTDACGLKCSSDAVIGHMIWVEIETKK